MIAERMPATSRIAAAMFVAIMSVGVVLAVVVVLAGRLRGWR